MSLASSIAAHSTRSRSTRGRARTPVARAVASYEGVAFDLREVHGVDAPDADGGIAVLDGGEHVDRLRSGDFTLLFARSGGARGPTQPWSDTSHLRQLALAPA